MSDMMGEIGGYFGLETFGGRMYHEDLIAVNSARNALVYILRARAVRKLYVPVFLCDTVAMVCEREGCSCETYHVDESFLPVFDHALSEGEFLYVVNYYGQISDEQIRRMKARWGRIIVDHVQAFFRRPLPDVDTVYSCRKFYGVPDGGFVSTQARLADPLPTDRSAGRMRHVLGRFEDCGSAYYRDFQLNDESFYDLPLMGMSALTRNILRAVDDEAVCMRREQNYAALDAKLGRRNRLPLTEPVGPYAYPFYCPDGLTVRKALAEQKIYVATLWPNVLEHPAATELERDYAMNILPLPCDQRYGEREMNHMADLLISIMDDRSTSRTSE